jgi:hypothetical protein
MKTAGAADGLQLLVEQFRKFAGELAEQIRVHSDSLLLDKHAGSDPEHVAM